MIVPEDGMLIEKDVTFRPGIYYLPRGIRIAADDITLDGNGAVLVGTNRLGRGVSIKGRNGITLKNLTVMEYYHGFYLRDCTHLTIANCRATATDEVAPSTIFLDVWLPVEKVYGGGMLLWNVSDSHFEQNDLQHQMNGMHAYGCQRLTVRKNLANHCSGWGFHLYETCDSLFEENLADFCCRYHLPSNGPGHMGADAAGFLVVSRSCRNTFRRNSARLSGDGFFLGGMNPQFEPVGCDENLFEENDGSYSPNIAFEATFCSQNIFRNNIANRSNYGFWLGFSRHTILEKNEVKGNRQAGIATENGFDFQVRHNMFTDNAHGILLWSKRLPDLEAGAPENTTSYAWIIEENTFVQNNKAIRIAADQDHGIRPLSKRGEWGLPAPHPHGHVIRANQMERNPVDFDLIKAEDTLLEDNQITPKPGK